LETIWQGTDNFPRKFTQRANNLGLIYDEAWVTVHASAVSDAMSEIACGLKR
jgi:hypothetical protein